MNIKVEEKKLNIKINQETKKIEVSIIDNSDKIDLNLTNYNDKEVRNLIQENTEQIEELDNNKADRTEIKTKTSELINDSNFVSDSNYVHTDNNYTTVEKKKLSNLENYDDTEVRQLIDEKQPKGNYLTEETDPTVPNHIKSITQKNITSWNNKADISDIPDVSNFVKKDTNQLTNYELKTNTGSLIDLEINDKTYVVTLKLKNSDGTTISTDTIDLPLETVVVSGSYDSSTKEVVLLLESGSEIRFSVADLVSGLQSEITSSNKLDSDLIDDSNSGNKFVTSSQKTAWNNKYEKPSGGIPKTDLESSVQTSLGKADTSVQKDGGSTSQTISLSSGTGTTALAVKSRATSSYISFSNNSVWVGSYGVSSDKKPVFYNGEGYTLAYTSDIPKYYHGTCATAAATRLKVVECEGFVLEEGATISVTFTNAQTYNGAPQLNVNGTGAVVVQYKQGTSGIRYMWSAGEIIDFTYNGEYWVCHGRALATTTYYGAAKLSASAVSTSTSLALTPSVINATMENIVTGYDAYSTSATYEVGDRVRYSTHVYECIEAIPVKEAWTAEHWKIVDPLQKQIDDLEARIKALENS